MHVDVEPIRKPMLAVFNVQRYSFANEMKRILTIILGFTATMMVLADDMQKPPDKNLSPQGLFFSKIILSNESVLATMPLTQTRFLSFLNGTNAGFVSPSHVFVLSPAEKLKLVDKHWAITATPIVTQTSAELNVIQVFDGRSFGDSVKTNVGTIKLK